jgi:aryl carrier-like protein
MLYESMLFEEFEAVIQSKVAGAWNIHNSLLGAKLDFFVVLSSIAGIIGNKGQAAYAAANTFLDSLVRHRRGQGLPGVAIDLPAMDDVGYLSENLERRDSVMGTLKGSSATEAELLAMLTAAIEGFPGWSPDAQILTGLNIEDSSRPPYTIHDARFTRLVKATAKANGEDSILSFSLKQVVSTAACARDAELAVIAGLIEKLSAILLVSPEELGPGSSVKACGLDSLNAIELRNWISKELLAHLQVLELLTSDTMMKLAALILRKSQIQLRFRAELV